MHRIAKNGSTSNILRVTLRNNTTGAGLTGLSSASAGLIISTIASTEASATTYTQAGSTIETIATLGTFAAPTATKCRFKEIDAVNHKGDYEVQIADARYAVSSAKSLRVSFTGATGLLDTTVTIQLTSVDVDNGNSFGLAVLPASAVPGAANGLYIAGSNAATTEASYTCSSAFSISGNLGIGNDLNIGHDFNVTNDVAWGHDWDVAGAITWDTTWDVTGAVTMTNAGNHINLGPGGTGGALAITIKMTSDGVTPIQGAFVAVYNGAILIGTSTTDVLGLTSGLSADAGTYSVTATANGYVNFSGSITVTVPATFTKTMTATPPLPAPSAPNLCTVGGYVYDDQGNPLNDVEITIQVVRGSPHRPITSNGTVIAFKPVVIVTGTGPWADGYAQAEVDRTDSFDQADVTYSITSDGGELNNTQVILDTATKNFKDL